MENKHLTLGIEVRVTKDDRKVEFVISNETVDRHGTVIPLSAWNLERYKANPIVTYGHSIKSDNPDLIVGTSELKLTKKELIGIVSFEPEDVNPLAEKVRKKVKSGTIRMASVGFIPIKHHWGDFDKGENPDVLYFDEVELIEWSIVPVGSNPDALKRYAEFKEECKSNCEIKNEERAKLPVNRLEAEMKIKERKYKN